jgi:hypothetical protein
MGCCQATLITELPARAAQANKTTGIFLSKFEREYNDDKNSDGDIVLDDDHATGVALQGGFVRYDHRAMTATATVTTATRTEYAVAASSPPDRTKKIAAKKKVKI